MNSLRSNFLQHIRIRNRFCYEEMYQSFFTNCKFIFYIHTTLLMLFNMQIIGACETICLSSSQFCVSCAHLAYAFLSRASLPTQCSLHISDCSNDDAMHLFTLSWMYTRTNNNKVDSHSLIAVYGYYMVSFCVWWTIHRASIGIWTIPFLEPARIRCVVLWSIDLDFNFCLRFICILCILTL